jgi:hypothetical protein
MMGNKRKAGCAMFFERPFPKIQDLLKGFKEGILRHIHDGHVILGNIKF